MKYTSTRDTAVSATSARAVINGISKDGGLFVPKELPSLDYKKLLELNYAARADTVLRAFFDFDTDGVSKAAYEDFDEGDPAPTVKLDDNLFVLELWHGKTCAYSDMSLSVLPGLLASAKKSEGNNEKTLVLVASSGDTGEAALEWFRGVPGTEAVVFYPTEGVGELQRLAMTTLDGDNVCAVAVNGTYGEVQSAVKKAFSDESLTAALKEKGMEASFANSVNVGSLVPQIACYFSAYCDLVDSNEIKPGEKIDFCVPTEFFGSVIAGYYAYKMGLPVNKLICASNKFDVFADFIETGVYDVNRKQSKSNRPSADMLFSSNLERLLFETCGRNGKTIAARADELSGTGRTQVTPKEIEEIRSVFACECADDDAVAAAIEEMFDEYGYLIDTHTAAAYAAAAERGLSRKTVVVSGVNPFKCAPAVLTSLGERAKGAVTKEMLEDLVDFSAMEIPDRLIELFAKKKRFTDVIEKEGVTAFIKNRFGV